MWEAIRSRPIPNSGHYGLGKSGRPANFDEMGTAVFDRKQDFDFALSHFLDEIYLFKNPHFLDREPPASFSQKDRAFLAATAEWLAGQFAWEPALWIDKPEYFLPEEWDYLADLPEFPEALRPQDREKTGEGDAGVQAAQYPI